VFDPAPPDGVATMIAADLRAYLLSGANAHCTPGNGIRTRLDESELSKI